MSRPARLRLLVIVAAVLAVEILCRTGAIDPFTMIAPSDMVVGLVQAVGNPELRNDIAMTMTNVAVALVLAIVIGFFVGALLSLAPRVRRVVDPVLASWYAIPIFVFYPLLIVLFGLTRMPQIAIGFLLAVVAMVINTLNGFDRVPRVLLKTARVMRLGMLRTVFLIVLPYAMLYIFTGMKLAVAYSFIGVIAAEFIMSGEGLGYQINFAYNNFDNDLMYPLILLIMVVATTINMALHAWEKRFRERQTERTP